MVAAFLFLLFALAIAISAKPVLERKSPVKLALTKRRILADYNVMERDVRRAGMKFAENQNDSDSPAGNIVDTPALFSGTGYTVEIAVGSPPTSYSLLIDSGSSNTWVGASKKKPYMKTSTSQQTDNEVAVTYGSGSFIGIEFIDQISLATNLVITNQSIGAAMRSKGFPGVDGILGIGPVDLTNATLIPDTGATIPTVTDNLFASGAIPDHLVAVAFQPFNNSTHNGEMSWGGTDSSKFVGNITYTPITSTSPANGFWGIDASVTYGSTTLLQTTAGIVDTGTTLILLATNAFDAYKNATNAVLDSTTDLLTVTPTQFAQLQSLSFNVAGVEFTLNADAQIWPRSLNSVLGGIASQYYLVVSDIGAPSGSGLDFILGMSGLERFYAVFDTAGSRVGLANTPFTNGTFNNLN